MAVFDKEKLFDAEKVTKSLESIVWGTPMLIPCKTNTNWWHDFVIPYAERDAAVKAINQSHHNTDESYVKIKYRIAPVYVLDEFENIL